VVVMMVVVVVVGRHSHGPRDRRAAVAPLQARWAYPLRVCSPRVAVLRVGL
jgi:hypothetical protein